MLSLLDIKKLSIRGPEILVKDSDFFINRGEMVGLFGRSGSGKSVFSFFLIGLLNRSVFSFSAERAFVNSLNFSFDLVRGNFNWNDFRKKHISMVFQDPSTSLNPTMICGKQLKEACFHVPKKERFNYCLSLLEDVGITNPLKTFYSFPHQLSGGQKQRVVIAIALAPNPSLLIADEPTTSLDPSTQRSVLDLIVRLKKTRSFGVVLISHNLELVQYYCDRTYIFENKFFYSSESDFGKNYINSINSILNRIKSRKQSKNKNFYKLFNKKKLNFGFFKAVNISVSFLKNGVLFYALKNICFDFFSGDCLGVVGGSGSGKTTLGRVICGIEKNFSGSFLLPPYFSTKEKSIQMVYQDPFSSFNPKKTVGDSVSEIIVLSKTNYSLFELFDFVSLKRNYCDKYPHELSGGEKQRVSIARVLASNPSVIVFDESLSALDLKTQFLIMDLIRFINKKLRISVVFISHDINSVYSLCNKIIVLKDGSIIDSFKTEKLFSEKRHLFTKSLICDSNFL